MLRNLGLRQFSALAIRGGVSGVRRWLPLCKGKHPESCWKLDSVLYRALEGLAAGYQAHAPRALVDDRSKGGVGKVLGAACSARIDQACASQIAIGHLVAAQVDRMFARQFGANALIELAVTGTARVKRPIAAIVLREFLLDDVGLDRAAKVIGLSGEVCGKVMIFVLLEGVVAKVAPKDGGHAKLVCQRKGFRDFDDFTRRVFRSEIDGRANRGGSHVVGILHRAKKDFLLLVWVSQQFVVIDFDQERDLVRVFAGNGCQHAER